MASYQAACKRAASRPLLVYDWHNIESELLEQYGAAAPSAAHGIYARLTAVRVRAMEQGLLAAADAHLVCSRREREALVARVPGAEVLVTPNGVDPESFPEASPAADARVRSRLVFVGSMDYHANISAAVEFTTSVWPALRPHLPGCQLTLVGCNPAPEVRALARQEGVVVTGTVPDVRPYYEEALAAVVPLRTGSGTRLKILEAMAARVPVVSSTLGAEGLDVSPGENVLIADSVTEWVGAIQRLASDKDLWRKLGAAGRALVEERYDWRTIGRSLRDTYMNLLSRRSAR
jgi:glycosyltransferase involved in cell wall biosynthesis